jgi:hypothetical protein
VRRFRQVHEWQFSGPRYDELRILHRGPMQPMQAGLVLKSPNPSYDSTMTPFASVLAAGIEPIAPQAGPMDASRGTAERTVFHLP